MTTIQNFAVRSTMNNKSAKPAFKSYYEDDEAPRPPIQRFKVNKNLEYTGAVAGNIASFSFFGLLGGLAAGMIKNAQKVGEQVAEQASKNEGKFLAKHAGIGAAIGAAVGLLTTPWAKERARQSVYQKQIDFDVMANVSDKAKHGDLSVGEANSYMTSRAWDKMAVNPAASGYVSPYATAGLISAGTYAAGDSRSSKSSK